MSISRSSLRASGAGLLTLALLAAGGCGGEVKITEDAGTSTGTGGSGGEWQFWRFVTSSIDKIDLLLMIDNSRSMADKQQILAATVPDLVRGLVSPPCVLSDGTLAAQQPAGPLDACPEPNSRRRHPPIHDIHVAVISSSIGGHGSDACPASETYSCPGGTPNATNNDHGHLISRTDPCAAGSVTTYQGTGFLAWDPVGKQLPPGEASLGAIAVDPATGAVTTTSPGLVPQLKDLVLGAGQVGCGYEASIESWYRFLVDPDPYETITVDPATLRAEPEGLDVVLLQQRKDFLRPSSLLAIVGLTDENDCSIKEYGQFYFAAQQRDPGNPNKNFHLPKARSECATNPNDKCCRSCGQDQSGCPADPNCTGALDEKTDDVSLRCFDQKRRFGIDFLYPIDRYVTGLTSPLVPNRTGDMVPNPIFSDLDPTDSDDFVRTPSGVFLTYIVGVPWQDIARDPTDLEKGFRTPQEMAAPFSDGHSTWDIILGDPSNYVPPLDPHMIESTAPRSGINPITGDSIAPPSTNPGVGPDKINGHEYTPGTVNGTQLFPDDLQYACIFPLPQPRDCSDPNAFACDCTDPLNDNPLCEPVDPSDPTSPRTKQVRAKAYPGIRQLALIKALGTQGLVGSICPAQLTDPSSPAYGYRPAVTSLLDRLTPVLDGVSCLAQPFDVDAAGHIGCVMVEARNTGQQLDTTACAAFCAAQPGRSAVPAAHASAREHALADPSAKLIGADCVCELEQLGGPPGCGTISSELAACQCDPSATPTFQGKPVDGWCYIDATTSPPTGNPEIVAQCEDTAKRQIRFVGAGTPAKGAVVLLACTP